MKFDWRNWNFGGKVIFVSACLAAASMLMKWVDAGIISQTGLSQQSYIFLAFWVYPVLKLFKNKAISRILGVVFSILSVIITSVYISSKSGEMFGVPVSAAGSGAYLFLIASIMLTVGVIKYKPATISGDKAEQ
jgi:hypothetical protein